jgi:RHS repeat-associated protein
VKYPSGRKITYALNSSGGYTAGRMASAQDTANSINYVTSATYAPDGQLSGLTDQAGIVGRMSYNSRLQPLQMVYTTGTAPSSTQLTESTCPTGTEILGDIMHRIYHFGLGSNDNGNVQSIDNCRDTTRTATFNYDVFNRIVNASSAASSGSTSWGEAYTVDPWGNLTNIGQYNGKTNYELLNAAPASVKNQLNGFCHDAAGNLVLNAVCPSGTLTPTYNYDIENRLASAALSSTWTYTYDGDGQRAKKCSPCSTGSGGTLYWRSPGGDPLVELNLGGTLQYEYIFFNGKRIARRDGTTNPPVYYFADHLGSASVITNSTGAIQDDCEYYPYGGQLCYTNTLAQNYKFTGKERDAESGLDNFGARYHASTMGRFMSPDPKQPNLKHLFNPQKWNKYAYTLNNPLRYVDPDGLEEMDIQLRAAIQAQSVGDPLGRRFAGDNRGFTSAQNVTSRTSITVRIETDASKRPGNPIIGVTSPPAGHTNQIDANGNVIKTGQQTQGLPTVTGSRDANGNAVLNFQQNAQNPLEPQSITPAIRTDLNVSVNQAGTSVTTVGTVSGSPSFELNVGTEGGSITNIPLQTESSGDTNFGLGLFQTNSILNVTPLPPPPPPCAQDKEKSCSQ